MPAAAMSPITMSRPGRVGPAVAVLLGFVAAALNVGAVVAQDRPATTPQATSQQGTGPKVVPLPQWFALPWEITFAHIDDAMMKGTYRLRQVRRILNRTGSEDLTSTWISVVEDLVHGAVATGQPGQRELFDLQFVSLENTVMSAAQLQLAKIQYAEKAGFLYNFQSFRVFDVTAATSNYVISFLGIGQRAKRAVYRVAAHSRLGGRSGWLLELDLETGYPLYRGEYETSGALVSEVEVLGYDPNYAGPLPLPAPQIGITRFSDPSAAATKLQLPSRVVPLSGVLQSGYAFGSAKSVTDPFTGLKKLILIYSDGIDQVFLTISSDPRESLGEGHVFTSYRDAAGITQASFVDRGIQFVVIARGTEDAVHSLVYRLFAQVVK